MKFQNIVQKHMNKSNIIKQVLVQSLNSFKQGVAANRYCRSFGVNIHASIQSWWKSATDFVKRVPLLFAPKNTVLSKKEQV